MKTSNQHFETQTALGSGNVEDSYPLSTLQHGMLFHNLLEQASGVDIEQIVITLHEDLDLNLFMRAWERVLSRHSILRTAFEWEGKTVPQQNVHRSVAIPLAQFDWCGLSPEEQKDKFETYLREDRNTGFDLASPPLFRIAVFQTSGSSANILWTFHHALLDGRSYRICLREVFAFYDAFLEGQDLDLELPHPYKTYIEWEASRDLSDVETFWRGRVGDLSVRTPMVVARKVADHSQTVFERGQFETRLSQSLTARLRKVADENDLTLNTVIQSAWSLLLSFYSNEADVVFGVTRACRHSNLEGLDSMLGLFINTVPMRVKVARTHSVLDLLRAVRQQHVELRAYESTPLVKIQEWSGIEAGASLFESIVVFDNAELDAGMKALGGKWLKRDFRVIEQTNYPMSFFAYGETELLIRLVYDESRFDRVSVERIAGHLEQLLTSIADDPKQTVAELSLLTDRERSQILCEWNATNADYSADVRVHQLFEAQAARTPDAVAVAFEDRELTYADVNRRANYLARKLVDLGIGPDGLVGISLHRSPEMVIGMLAVLKAGGAYVPLDPEYPTERLEFMIADADVRVLLTDRSLDHLTIAESVHTVNTYGFWDDAQDDVNNFTTAVEPGSLAYVIYTSGSTGVPKGVMVEHRNVVNFICAMDRAFGTDAGVWLALTSISFDISVLELFWTLARGYKVVIQGGSAASAYAVDESADQKAMDFSLFYFASDHGEGNGDKYRLLLEGARFADTHKFAAVWTPERHFHSFGGLYPNPSVTSAAIAAVTKNVQVRAGSVVLPLHDPIRVAEEWSVVDNISNGRVGIAFASGWHASDFALAPDAYADRKEVMRRGIATVRSLWSGEAITRTSGDRSDVDLKLFPRPIQNNLPVWLTAAGSPDTFRAAGELGANLLTNLLGQSVEDLAMKIRVYREAFEKSDRVSTHGKVTLMLHTFVSSDKEFVRQKVCKPFTKYLRTSVDLIKTAPWAYPAFQKQSRLAAKERNETLAGETVTESDLDAMAEHAFDRYFETSGLFGTPETCLDLVKRLKEIGVDEIACLVDFNVDVDSVLQSLEHLDRLRQLSNRSANDYSIPAQIARHKVTHLQCTPSAARLMLSDERTRASLRSLKHIALGGEALPANLVHEVADATGATIHNMYGPTETTIWSTTTTLTGNETTVSIGRPVANTQIFILDGDHRPVPIGVPGELYIGGHGVARGYLKQPDLTAERFIRNPFGIGSDRLYKTGDVAAYRSDGSIEFLGRVDHQVKVRGYRVEPEEIQALLDRHPEVRQSVVHARDDASEGKTLIAYVVGQNPDDAALQRQQVDRWNTVWNEAYSRNGNATPTTKNFAGWNNSYDGRPIPEAEMDEWLDGTVGKILALKPSRVLEIGCGTGLLLFKIAPFCSEYCATDISKEALEHVRRTIDGLDTALPVTLHERAADDFTGLSEGIYDAVVLNSVVQYFPDREYLLKVLRGAIRMVRPGGNIFIGDVRSLPLLEAFHASVELHRASVTESCANVLTRVKERINREQELAIAPEFFDLVQKTFTDVAGVEITLKNGRQSNELTKFRYDARLKVDPNGQEARRPKWITWSEDLATAEDVLAVVNDTSGDVVAVSGIPNLRLQSDVATLGFLKSSSQSVANLRERLGETRVSGVDPSAIMHQAEASSWSVSIRWSPKGADLFDVVFARGAESEIDLVDTLFDDRPSRDNIELTNQPVSGSSTEISSRLRTYLTEKLPPYMVPSAFVLLEEIPLTPNGKLDRAALPAPENGHRYQAESYSKPANEVEEAVADLWVEILGIDKVGTDKSFFHVGGHSLLATQLVSRLRSTFRTKISLREVFDSPTIAGISNCLLQSETASGQVNKIARIMKEVKHLSEANGAPNGDLN